MELFDAITAWSDDDELWIAEVIGVARGLAPDRKQATSNLIHAMWLVALQEAVGEQLEEACS
jgi:hypothetical protein